MPPVPEPAPELHRRIHLGCGDNILPGYLNVDARARPGVDRVAEITDLGFLADGSCEVIYVSHALEHLATAQVAPFLRQCCAKLEAGGRLLVAVPDLEEIFRQFLADPNVFGLDRRVLIDYVYGGQDYPTNFHKTGFTFEILAQHLREAGFGTVRRFDADRSGVHDSAAEATYRGGISLNVEATRGDAAGAAPAPLRAYGPGARLVRWAFMRLFRTERRLRRRLAGMLQRMGY
jgi:predicted SAM-dependent methyltransferase